MSLEGRYMSGRMVAKFRRLHRISIDHKDKDEDHVLPSFSFVFPAASRKRPIASSRAPSGPGVGRIERNNCQAGIGLAKLTHGDQKVMRAVDQFAAGTSVTAKTRTPRLLGKLRLCTAF
jgi:hypothetical protein